jgi:hypothetical protein
VRGERWVRGQDIGITGLGFRLRFFFIFVRLLAGIPDLKKLRLFWSSVAQQQSNKPNFDKIPSASFESDKVTAERSVAFIAFLGGVFSSI